MTRISPRTLSEFESGSGNPTLATLEKIAGPFGLQVTFLPPALWRMHTKKEIEVDQRCEAPARVLAISMRCTSEVPSTICSSLTDL